MSNLHFYEPGPFDEYIAELSSVKAFPHPDVWEGISKELDIINRKSRVRSISILSIAASVAIVLSIGVSTFLLTSPSSIIESRTPWLATDFNTLPNPPVAPILASANPLPRTVLVAKPVGLKHKLKTIEVNTSLTNDFQEVYAQSAVQQTDDYLSILSEEEDNVENNNEEFDQEYNYPPFSIKEPKTLSWAQHNGVTRSKKQNNNKKSWSLIGFVNPVFTYNPFSAPQQIQSPEEVKVMSIGGDILIKKQIGSGLSLYSGISVSPTGQSLDNLLLIRNQSQKFFKEQRLQANSNQHSKLLPLSKKNREMENEFNNSLMEEPAVFTQNFYYMQLPLILSATVATHHLSFEFKTGLAAGILIDNKLEMYRFKGQDAAKNTVDRVLNTSVMAAVSISAPLTSNVDLLIEPNVQVHFNSFNHINITDKPVIPSLKVGVGYNF